MNAGTYLLVGKIQKLTLDPSRYGYKCRFLGAHVNADDTGNIALIGDEDKKARAALTANELNFVGSDIRNALRTRKVSLFYM